MPGTPKIRPMLWFDGQAEEAAKLYVSIFPNSKILERRGPAADHPVLGGLPETEYLKAFFIRPL